MKIAILGATSQIAKDLIVSFSKNTEHCCVLFSRSPEKVVSWLNDVELGVGYPSHDYMNFSSGDYDAVINFVGVGDPSRAKAMGAAIFDITHQYDQMALDYIQLHPACKYIFLSSGAAYGDVFDKPVNEHTQAHIAINDLNPSHWYGIAKLYAEARHRALPERSIVDVRVFNYFSHTQDMNARFFITDVLRAIRDKTVLKTSPENIVRDFLHPSDFYQLVDCLLKAENLNVAVDCYSKAAVQKFDLLSAMKTEFGLDYECTDGDIVINATGNKPHYYSLNTQCDRFGYIPTLTSLDGILRESQKLLEI